MGSRSQGFVVMKKRRGLVDIHCRGFGDGLYWIMEVRRVTEYQWVLIPDWDFIVYLVFEYYNLTKNNVKISNKVIFNLYVFVIKFIYYIITLYRHKSEVNNVQYTFTSVYIELRHLTFET